VELDHVLPLFKGGADDDTNRQGLCAACHAVKTAADRGFVQRMGCDDDGRPLDPNHPWNVSRRGST
jgi:5-methylcytosine-specific restriction enzyme A